jgi:trehalose/maltose transport system substrate-binding protein
MSASRPFRFNLHQKHFSLAAALFLSFTLSSCQKPASEPVTLTFFRLGWAQPDEMPSAGLLSDQFIRETGIQLRTLPVPETTLDQLSISRKLLEAKSGPDVLGVDFIWSGVLADDLMDLQSALSAEISLLNPDLVPSYLVDGKLVAVPYTVQLGVLEYRKDLLREYGYDHPPATWDELERMSEHIQKGERAKGNPNFYGYVWQGAEAEALTCNAIEWQASDGGGRIVEDNHTVSVNNPAAIRSWRRARHWIGWISPPSVLAFRELDSINSFDSGNAAFNRVWGGTSINRGGTDSYVHARTALAEGKTGYALMPRGSAGPAAALGGSGLAISRNSLHPREAIQLARFMIRSEVRMNEEEERKPPADRPGLFLGDQSNTTAASRRQLVVRRPSNVVGAKYEAVAKAYMSAVHSVLAGQQDAAQAAKQLEKQLIQLTGFPAGPPQKLN